MRKCIIHGSKATGPTDISTLQILGFGCGRRFYGISRSEIHLSIRLALWGWFGWAFLRRSAVEQMVGQSENGSGKKGE